jgi:5-methylthioadenosine/S-adenosylhomocysteine deaminase
MRLYSADYVYANDSFQEDWAMAVKDGKVEEVGPREQVALSYPYAEHIRWEGCAIVPGTVNAHAHSFQSLLRGMAIDKPFLEWRDQALYKHTPLLDEEAIYTGALFAFAEMLRSGVTTVADFFYVHGGGTDNDEAVIRAAKDLGIRLTLARTMYDWPGAPEAYRERIAQATQNTLSLAKRYQGDPTISIHPAPHSPHAASPEMIRAGHKLAKELATPYHIHVAEEMFEVQETLRDYGLRPVHYLDSLGVLDDSMIAIHLVHLDDSEVRLLGERGCSLAYCPSSNMFLADGVTRIPNLMNSGVKIALGTDGGCSNNRLSVFEEMRMCALLQKVARMDGTCISADQVFRMGTANGGEILRAATGRLAPGAHADFIALDTHDFSLTPKVELFANTVYSMQPTAVSKVVVAGKLVYEDGEFTAVNARSIVRRVNRLREAWQYKSTPNPR